MSRRDRKGASFGHPWPLDEGEDDDARVFVATSRMVGERDMADF